jgi:hypothetical protein
MPKTAFTEATFDAADHSSLFTELGGSEATLGRVSDGTAGEYVGYLYRMQDAWTGGPAFGTPTEVGLELALPASGDFGPVRSFSVAFSFYLREMNFNPGGSTETRTGPCYIELATDADVSVAHWGILLNHLSDGTRTLTFGLGAVIGGTLNIDSYRHSWITCRMQYLSFDVSGVYASALGLDVYSERVVGEPVFLGQYLIPTALMGFTSHHVKRVVVGFKDVEQERDFYDLRVDEIRIFRNYPKSTSYGPWTLAPLPRQSRGAQRLTLVVGGGDSPGATISNLLLETGFDLLIEANGVATNHIDLDSLEVLTFVTLEDESGVLARESSTADRLAKEQ